MTASTCCCSLSSYTKIGLSDRGFGCSGLADCHLIVKRMFGDVPYTRVSDVLILPRVHTDLHLSFTPPLLCRLQQDRFTLSIPAYSTASRFSIQPQVIPKKAGPRCTVSRVLSVQRTNQIGNGPEVWVYSALACFRMGMSESELFQFRTVVSLR
jgi:hypothetical protein